MLIYLQSLEECQDRKGPCYLLLLMERLKMLHLALYGELPTLAIASSYFKNSPLLELWSPGPNFSYKPVHPNKCLLYSMAQFELVRIPLSLHCGYYFPYSWSTNSVLRSRTNFLHAYHKKKITEISKCNFRVIVAGKSNVVSVVNFILILVRI